MTADDIMALADNYATGSLDGDEENFYADRAALRAAVERVVQERDHAKIAWDDAVSYANERVGQLERAEAEMERLKERQAFWLKQAELREKWLQAAEARLAEAEGMLKEAQRNLGDWHEREGIMPDHDAELLDRIDAFLNVPQS